MKRYVQRKGGQGEKWEVSGEGGHTIDQELFFVAFRDGVCFHLPKSDYDLCEPPEEWEDVTGEYQTLGYTDIISIQLGPGCRFKLIDGFHHGPCFIIERKKS